MHGFAELMKEFEFDGAMMASEIDIPRDLTTAKDAGMALFGAGGFFGDSEKVWDPEGKNISMAVKVLRVYVAGKRTSADPVKTGDDVPGAGGEGKFEVDGLLS